MIILNEHEISASIRDRYANIIYSFYFENTLENDGSDELKFEITIDPTSFISKFEADIDGEIFIGKTKEKEIASKEYCEAKEKNENAILISQPHKNIPNVFEIKTNIDSNSKIFLKIEIEQYLQKTFGCNNYLSIQILRNFDKYNIKQNFKHISVKLNIEDESGIYDVNIPMIDKMINNDIFIDMNESNTKCQITYNILHQSNINELILKYKIRGESDESHILFDNKTNTFCHIISDIITDSIIDEKHIDEEHKDMIENKILIPRRIVFLIDRSGSMKGSKWIKTISSTIMAIKQLKQGFDRFAIILFDNLIELLPYKDTTQCILADNKNISDSIQALQHKNVGRSTNINDALLEAIKLIKNDILLLNDDSNYAYNFFMNQIIFITDGEPNNGESDTNNIITNVQNANNLRKIDKYNNKISIFSFGVGSDGNDSGWIKDLNHSFLKILSVNNNGFYQRIKKSSADTSLGEYFNILSQPILSNINAEYKNKDIKHLTNTKFNTLFSGNDLIICGKIENKQNNDIDYNLSLTISAITGKQIKSNNKLVTKPINISKEIQININRNNKDNTNNIERIWAYLKLQEFATKKLIHQDMIEMDENEKKEEEALPLSLALKYKFVTPWTSMIVVKKKDDTEQKEAPQQQQQQQQQQNDNTKQTFEIQQQQQQRPPSTRTTRTTYRGGGGMYDDIIHLAMDQQLLTEIREREPNYIRLPIWNKLRKTESTQELEQELSKQDALTFDIIFHEPVGHYLMESFLKKEHSVDKALFITNVEIYKNLQDSRAREKVATKIYEEFCDPETNTGRQGVSVFRRDNDDGTEGNNKTTTKPTSTMDAKEEEHWMLLKDDSDDADDPSKYQLSLLTENTNSIGVYGRPIKRLKQKLERGNPDNNIFDEIAKEVYNDLRLDVFPRFCRSHLYQMYLRCKTIEQAQIGVRDFHQMRMLGRGAFGCVNACKKKDTGKLYAMKQINKKRVSATESAETIMSERNFLADMDSVFVTTLKYAFMDDQTLYLILDLMIGGDLKFHLNNDKTFSEERSRFYAAEVLLGLDHIHSKGIIYRDLKLENVLVDEKGHCKISDLGLAVRMSNDLVKGYAGTPGYTAPEVVLSHYYDHIVDFFSLGVMIYRFLCGKKPFQSKRRHHGRRHENRQENQRRRTTELDRNIVEMEPDFPSQYFEPAAISILKGLLCKNPKTRMGAYGIDDIKQHPWFDPIDFGLLEAGYLDPPFVPSLDEIHAEQQQHGRPPKDEIHKRQKLNPKLAEQLTEFPYVSKKAIQEEIVDVLKKVEEKRGTLKLENLDIDKQMIFNEGNHNGCLETCVII